MPSPPAVRVIIRLPYNRPEDAPADPPRIEWNADKEHILWEVIAKSRAIEGAGTDWKGLAQHLQVPLPYLLYRAQVRYEEDLRGLQGLNGLGLGLGNLALGIRTAALPPAPGFPSDPSPSRANGPVPGLGEYLPRPSSVASQEPTRPPFAHRESGPANAQHGSLASPTGTGTGRDSTASTGTSTLRPHIGVRARLSSLGHAHGRALAQPRAPLNSNNNGGGEHAQRPGAYPNGTGTGTRTQLPTKKASSSTITLQGPKRVRSPALHLQPLSPAASSSDGDGVSGGEGEGEGEEESSEEEDDDESDEEARRADEAERQEALAQKLRDLERLMTKDALGLVADPGAARANGHGDWKGNGSAGADGGWKQRGRVPPSGMGASLSSSGVGREQERERAREPRNQSLSSASVDSPQGSIPSIPSPQAQSQQYAYTYQYQYPAASPGAQSVHSNGHGHGHQRHHSQGYGYGAHSSMYRNSRNPQRSASQSQSLSSHSLSQSRSNSNSHSHSDPQSPTGMTSPMPIGRHLATPDKTSSPPALSPGSARGQTVQVHGRAIQIHRDLVAGTPSGSEASSFSDISDASLSQSALESALMSNMSNMSNVRSAGSRMSYRNRLPSKRSSRS